MRAMIGCAVMAAATLAWTTPASANGPSEPGRSAPICDVGLIEPDASAVPANIPAFFLAAPSAPEIELHRITDGGAEPVALTIVARPSGGFSISPEGGLTAGEAYRFEYPRTCDGFRAPATLSFRATPEAPLPAAAGTITMTELRAANFGNPGPEHRTYYADISFVPDPGMLPWLEVYRAGWIIDGVRPPATLGILSELHANPWRVFVACGAYAKGGENIAPTGRPITYQLLSRPRTFDAEETVSNVVSAEFDCARALRVDGQTGRPLGPDEAIDPEPESGAGCSTPKASRGRDLGALTTTTLGVALMIAARGRRRRRDHTRAS